MINEYQESLLTNGGDNPLHYHSADRVMTHDSLRQLQELAQGTPVSVNTVLSGKEDLLLVDTTVGNITITLPLAIASIEIEVMKNAAPNRVSVLTSGTNTILGTTEARIYNYGTSLRFKAITGGWIII